MSIKTMGRSVIMLVFAALISACTGGMPAEFPAPDFAVEDIFTGKEIRLSDNAGQPVLLYFFASW